MVNTREVIGAREVNGSPLTGSVGYCYMGPRRQSIKHEVISCIAYYLAIMAVIHRFSTLSQPLAVTTTTSCVRTGVPPYVVVGLRYVKFYALDVMLSSYVSPGTILARAS